MAFAATTILKLLVLLTWTCLSVPNVRKNALFTTFFFSENVLSEILSATALSFCPGLYAVVQAATPPTIDFFKSLPSAGVHCWAIYVIVLEKAGFLPLIYIGSGTHAKSGLAARWKSYDRMDAVVTPNFVLRAVKKGYEITHRGKLVWTPIPSAGNMPKTRLLFLALETAFSFLFLAMKSRKPDSPMISCCPWPLESFTYGGLCSHSPLTEEAAGDFDLTPEQLEAVAAEAAERKLQYNRDYHHAHKEEIRASKKIYEASEHGKKALKKAQDKFRKNKPGRKSAISKASAAKIKASGKYSCRTCNVNFPNPSKLNEHNATSRHEARVAKAAAAAGLSV